MHKKYSEGYEKKLLKWPTWHNKLQEALERMVWWNKYRVYLSTENLDHPICIYVQHLSVDKNGGDKQWRTLSGARTLCKCQKGKVAVVSDTYSCRKQVLVVEMFTRALVVWMRLNCFAKMSKSLLICGLETVPETCHSIPVVHTSLSILSNVAEDTVAWYQTKKFYFQMEKKSKTQHCHKYFTPGGGGGVPHRENQPLRKVPFTDVAGNRDGNALLV